MSYSNNPLLPKARADAVRLLILERLPVSVAARKSGVHRTTLWRWKRQWLAVNQHVQLENSNRPNRTAGSKFRLTSCRWLIPTRSSKPHSNPRSVSERVIRWIRYYRQKYGRCAAVVHAYCRRVGVMVSLSTVRRVLRRLGLVVRPKYVRRYRPPVGRPVANCPGALVEVDAIHLTSPLQTKQRAYLYTLVDVYSRWAYVEYAPRLSQALSIQFVRRAQASARFHFACIQADNGAEFGRQFEESLQTVGTTVRHSRVRRPNDNAHVERFNRTIQEECVGSTNPFSDQLPGKVLAYLAYYNQERLHLGLQCKTPASMLRR